MTRVSRRLRHGAIEQQLRERDAGNRRVERILAGFRASETVAEKTGDGVQIESTIGPDTLEHRAAAGGARRGSDFRVTATPSVRSRNAGYISATIGRPAATSAVSGPSKGQSATRSRLGVMISRQTHTADRPTCRGPTSQKIGPAPASRSHSRGAERGLAERPPEVSAPDAFQAAERK